VTSTINVAAAPLAANVEISVSDPELASATASAIEQAFRDVLAVANDAPARVVRLRTRKRLARLGPETIAGALVVVRLTAQNARRLRSLVGDVRAAGALGVQIVWDGASPARADVERHVFATLEDARATPGGPPVVLAEDVEPALALRLLVAHRSRLASTPKGEGGS
jgi:hypothetical protein